MNNDTRIWNYDIRGFFRPEQKWVTVQRGQGTKSEMNAQVDRLKKSIHCNDHYTNFYGLTDTSPVDMQAGVSL